MNMTDPITVGILHFATHPWVIFLVAIGGILIVIGYSTSFLKFLYDYRKRPQVKLKLIPNFENSEDGEERKATFLVYVHNFGKGILSECKIQIRITDHSGNKDLIAKTGKKYQEQFIPLPWIDEKGVSHDSQNLYPAKNEYGMLKLPLLVTIPLKVKNDSLINPELFGVEFTEPVKVSWGKPFDYLKALGKALTCYFVFSIFINSTEQSFEKKIRVAIPVNIIASFKDEYILFEEKNIKLFFSEALFSFVSLFQKFGDE